MHLCKTCLADVKMFIYICDDIAMKMKKSITYICQSKIMFNKKNF